MKKRIAVSIITAAMILSQFSFVTGKEPLKKNMDARVTEDTIEAESELEEEKQALLVEEESYSSQYLVWQETEQLDTNKLAVHAQQSFTRAKAQKRKKEKTVKEKIKNAEQKQEFTSLLGMNGAHFANRKIEQAEIESTTEGYGIIRLPEQVDPALFIEDIYKAAGGDVAYIQPDYVVELAAEADTEFQRQMVVRQEETEKEEQPEDMDSELEETKEETSDFPGSILEREADLQEAWKQSKGSGVTVALLDTGVDTVHPDLEGHVLEGYDFVNERKGVYDAELGMEQAHGTHIAGIIAGTAPEADILPLKVFENGRAYTSDILEAITFAEKQGASIVNMSFGCTDNNQALRQAMEESDMFFVCAAGNHRGNLDKTPIYPASFGLENSISVAALNQDLGLSYFSNYGDSVDIAAWGRDVYSCFPEREYGILDGTSMAAGYVSAAAALSLKDSGEKGLKERLKSTSDKLTCLDGKIAQGNKISFSGAVYGATGKSMVTVTPEAEFDDSYEEMSLNEQLELFSSKNNVAIAAGKEHALVLKDDGTVWAWGSCLLGALGDINKHAQSFYPVKVMLEDVKAISAGSSFNMALKKDGTIYTWGNNNYGKLGNGTTAMSSLPTRVAIASNYGKITGISAGYYHGLAVTESGKVLAWGMNRYGELGHGVFDDTLIPREVEGLNNIVEVSAGVNQSMALDRDGNVWVLGKDTPEHVGDGVPCISPVKVDVGWEIKKLSTGLGTNNALLTKEYGSVWSWGTGFLGDGYIGEAQIPQYIYGSNKEEFQKMVQISISESHSLALRENGSVWGWGQNAYGELGNGTTNSIYAASPLYTGVKAVASGANFSLVLKNDGTILAAGDNSLGQCGQVKDIKKCVSLTEVSFEENVSFDKAKPINLDLSYAGKILNSDEHYYYSFVPPVTGVYTFESISKFDTYGELYNSNKERILYNDDGGGAGMSESTRDFYMEYELIKGNTYYLVVSSYHESYSGSYTVMVKSKDDCGDDIEHAKQITEGNTSGRINSFSDRDMYRFTPEKTGYYEIQSASPHGLMAYVYDSAGIRFTDLIGNNGKTENPYDFYKRIKLTEGETYYIEVLSYKYTQEMDEYELTIMYYNDHGSDREDAENIQNGDSIDGKIEKKGNIDMFRFVPTESAYYVIESISNFDTYGILYDSFGKQITYNDDGNLKGESTNNRDFYIKHKLIKDTVYYIAIRAYSNSVTGSYVLKINIKDEYGGVMSSAHDISENYMTEGNIDYFGDTDAFVFIPKTSGTYILSTTGNTTLGGVSFKVDNHSNTTSLPLTYRDQNVRVEFNMNANEKHYFMVYNKDNQLSSLGAYKVYVETPLTVEVE